MNLFTRAVLLCLIAVPTAQAQQARVGFDKRYQVVDATLDPSLQIARAVQRVPTIGRPELNGGAAEVSFPIYLPAQISSASLDISLRFSSESSSDTAGYGWSIAGLASVYRCTSPHTNDGNGTISHKREDQYCLDGMRLVVVSGGQGQAGSTYRTEIDNFHRITANGSRGETGPVSFTIQDPNGRKIELGANPEARTEWPALNSIRSWHVTKIEDINGNSVVYRYDADTDAAEPRLREAEYSSNSKTGAPGRYVARFDYEPKPDPRGFYAEGKLFRIAQRLKSVEVRSQDVVLRKYTLSYEQSISTGRSLLGGIQECDAAGTCLRPTTFTWSQSGPLAAPLGPPQSNSGVHGLGAQRWFVDINGDGLPDYVAKSNDGSIHWNLNTGTGWGPRQTQAGVHGLGNDRWLVDINGDGLPDYVVKTSDGYIHWNLNRGVGYDNASAFGPSQSQGGVHGLGVVRWLADLNGDGLPDYIAKNDDGNIHWNINTGNGWGPSQTQSGVFGLGSERWLIDINGDGLLDYVSKTNDGNIHWSLNRGTGYNSNTAFVASQTQGGVHGLGAVRWLVDINGDGLPDYVAKNSDGNLHWNLNTGRGWAPSQSQGGLHGLGADRWFADLNGDGFPDYIAKNDDGNLHFNLNRGVGFDAANAFGSSQTQSNTHGLGVTRWMIDLNGDGLLDYVAKNDDGFIHFDLSNLKAADRLLAVTNVYGTRVMFDYVPLQAQRPRIGAEKHPYHFPRDDRSLVSRKRTIGTTSTSQQAVEYTYGSPLVDVFRRESMGFEWIQAKDTASGLVTEIINNQVFPLQGRPKTIIRRNSTGVILHREQVSWRIDSNQGIFQVFPSTRQEDAFDLVGLPLSSTHTETVYDKFGNLSSEVKRDSAGNISTRSLSFASFEDKWLIRLPVRLELRSNDRNRGVSEIARLWKYDVLGRRERESSVMGTASVNEKSFEYNNRGLITSETNIAKGYSDRRTEFEYDEFGQLVRTTNALGHTNSYSYNLATGQVVKQVDPNGHATSYIFDNFGRLTQMTLPSGDGLALSYAWGTGQASIIVTLQRSGLGDLTEEYDDQGRLLRLSGSNFEGKAFHQLYEYDAYGRLIRRSNRHFTGDESKWTQFEYDLLGRLVRRTNPDGRVRTMTYTGRSVKVVDEAGNEVERQVDDRGNVIQIKEPEAAESGFVWDMRGNLIAIDGPESYKATLSYDDRGNLSQVAEPHAGLHAYTWTPFGELLNEKAGTHTAGIWKYDVLGRPESLESSAGAVRWSYDRGAAGLGKIIKVETTDYTDIFQYHPTTGRVSAQARTIGGAELTTQRDNDRVGRLQRLVYPRGLVVEYEYNADGSPKAVYFPKEARTVWEAQRYDAAGRVVLERLGNGMRTQVAYETEEGRPQRIIVFGPHNEEYIQWNYDYDAVGNLTRISDDQGGIIREHFFDRLNRLVRFTDRQTGRLHTFEYSASGNMLRKDRVFEFLYGGQGQGRHAPTGVRGPAGQINYEYDAQGHLVSDGERRFRYDARGLLVHAKHDKVDIAVSYDDSGERVKLERKVDGEPDSAVTLYLGDLYRETRKGSSIVGRSYISVGGALVGIYVEVRAAGQPTRKGMIYTHLDHAGSIRMFTDDQGDVLATVDYGPFGEPVVRIKKDSLSIRDWIYDRTFVGLETDRDIGVINAKSRLLDAQTGRFLGPDPIFLGSAGSQELNRYAYASNNPTRFSDRTGLAREYSVLGESGRADRERYFNERREWADRQLDRLRVDRDIREGRFRLQEHLDRMPRLEAPKLGDSVFRNREPHYTLYPRTPAMPRGASVDRNTAQVEGSLWNFTQRFEDWYASVKSNGRWDYKKSSGLEWQDFGNFNYGATGAALGLPDEVILRGAGWYQEVKTPKAWDPSYGHFWDPFSRSRGDDPKDQWQIRQGIDYYRHRELIRWLEGERPSPSGGEQPEVRVGPMP